jgi:hypothetical protein
MTKMFIAEIGYQNYAISPDDATTLLKIAERSKLVKQPGYNGPYYIQAEQELWLRTLLLGDVISEPADAPAEPKQPTVPTVIVGLLPDEFQF